MTAPMFVTIIVNPNIPSTFTRPFLIIGSLLVVFSIIFFIVTRRMIPETPYNDLSANKSRVLKNPAEIFKSAKAWLYLLAGICYFSFAIGQMSWLPTYCQEIGMDFNLSGTVLTAFFVGALVMRFCGPLVLKKLTPRFAYIVFTLISALFYVCALLIGDVTIMMVLLALSGFMQGSCVAFLVLMCTATFPERIASASSLPFISASIAAMTAPLWMGAIAEHIGFFVPFMMICGLLALSVVPVVLIRKY
jgi:fucose permease